ncbi:hypothetical protein D4R75_03050 [bacterium]|nr:MAG: hypothetical protein D4R75_03050 [bacterium]
MVALLYDALILTDFDGDLLEGAREEMCVFHKDQDRQPTIGLESMWGIGDQLGFAFAEEAKKISKPVVGFSIK